MARQPGTLRVLRIGGAQATSESDSRTPAAAEARWIGAIAGPLRLVAALFVCVGLGFQQYGLGPKGSFYLYLSRHLYKPREQAPYFYESILHTHLANLLGFNGSHLEFSLFVLAFAVAGMLYVALVARGRISERWAYAFLGLLIFHPLIMISFSWVLHPDALTFLFTMIMFLSGSAYVVFAATLLGTLSHASQLLAIGVACLAMRLSSETRNRSRLAIALCAGWLVGRGLIDLYLSVSGMSYETSRFSVLLETDLAYAAERFLRSPLATLYTFYLSFWPLAVVLVAASFRLSPRLSAGFALSQLWAAAMALLTADTTRVFAIVSIGPFVYTLFQLLQHRGELPGRWRTALTATCLVCILAGPAAPKLYSFHGAVHGLEASRAHLHALLNRARQ